MLFLRAFCVQRSRQDDAKLFGNVPWFEQYSQGTGSRECNLVWHLRTAAGTDWDARVMVSYVRDS